MRIRRYKCRRCFGHFNTRPGQPGPLPKSAGARRMWSTHKRDEYGRHWTEADKELRRRHQGEFRLLQLMYREEGR